MVRIWRFAGKEVGRGACRLLQSRCSSVNDEREEIFDGMVPMNEFQERSSAVRVDCKLLLDARSDRGLLID